MRGQHSSRRTQEPRRPETSSLSQCHLCWWVRMLYKTYATRLLAAMDFDLRHRAFIQADGCAKNIMVLVTALDEAMSKQRPLCMASVNVAKAYVRVNLAVILRGMKCKGAILRVCGLCRRLLRELHHSSHNGKRYLTGLSDSRGKKGRSAVPSTLQQVIEEWLTTCDKNIEFESSNFSVDCMAFDDELVIMASMPRALQKQLCTFKLFSVERGMSINASKSLTMLPSGCGKVTKVVKTSVYRYSREDIPVVNTAIWWHYLGICFQAVRKERTAVHKEVHALLKNISKAPLKPQQRLVVLKYYMIPQLYHRLVLNPVPAKLLLKIDSLIRAGVRQWLVLPHDVPLRFFYARTEHGDSEFHVCVLVPGMRERHLAGLQKLESAICWGTALRNYATLQAQWAEKLCVYRGCGKENSPIKCPSGDAVLSVLQFVAKCSKEPLDSIITQILSACLV
ncbi:hypothetical protein HPB49_010998 [Dermacentor silvarum]|uniref:Uncharacterized protein n=1 Tax=Dermacentor silvarum TaxID=543639 RepID=A0ACB8D4Z0_DERSI|nr:hypothetical protein HPB49_010998 [Dermacentor silvarum]